MKPTKKQFRQFKNVSITLLGMSGVGKTYLSNQLREENWYHYSGDYRIGSHYLNEYIINNLKKKMMQIPFIKDLLLSDSIYIGNNISINNLDSISAYVGKIGDPDLDGLSYQEFKKRQKQFYQAEYSAMMDVPNFIDIAQQIYGYHHFINDAGGSLCEFYGTDVIDTLSKHTIIIYIQHNEQIEKELIQRSKVSPKPIFYAEHFLDEYLNLFKQNQKLEFSTLINPDDFIRYVFPKLLEYRKAKYERIANEYGYIIPVEIFKKIDTSRDFMSLIEDCLEG